MIEQHDCQGKRVQLSGQSHVKFQQSMKIIHAFALV